MRRRGRSVLRRALGALLAVVAGASLAACAPSGGPGPADTPTTPLPSGVRGAAHFDDGYLQAGSGDVVVDVYFDPMCPVCGRFEAAHGDALAGLVADGAVTLRLHPMTFLDRASQGTRYSTRAAAALTCVAAGAGDKTLDMLAALYEHQPEEGSAGLDDGRLVDLARGVGAGGAADCITSGRYRAWVNAVNDRALAGPLPHADIEKVTATPTVLIDGTRFDGPLTTPGPLEKAVTEAADG